MPFGDYKDFDACVAANRDKDSPGGYCAALHKKITGKYPSENYSQLEAAASVINLTEAEIETLLISDASGRYSGSLASFFQDAKTRTMQGVQVFKSGLHTDSQGRQRDWTHQELEQIQASFSKGVPAYVPIKLGHSSPEHTSSVAEALGLPAAVLGGEGSKGVGAATLGKVSSLSLNNGTLVADVEVPDSVANLVSSGMFTNVSSEIIADYQGKGPVLSGLALLGAERPAVMDLEGLTGVNILSDGTKPDFVYQEPFKYVTPPFGEETAPGDTEVTYKVPVTSEEVDANGNVLNRTVTVHHVRASNKGAAVRAVIDVASRFLSTFGTVVATGLGQLSVFLIARQIGKRINVGTPREEESGRARKTPSSTIEAIYRTLEHKSQVADDLYQYNLGTIVNAPLMILGAYAIGKQLWRVIVELVTRGDPAPVTPRPSPQHVRVWAADAEDAKYQATAAGFRAISASLTSSLGSGVARAFMSEMSDDIQSSSPSKFAGIANLEYWGINPGEDGDYIADIISDIGLPIGKVEFSVDEDLLEIDYIKTLPGSSFSSKDTRDLVRAVKHIFPAVTRITGQRISGAKWKGPDPDDDTSLWANINLAENYADQSDSIHTFVIPPGVQRTVDTITGFTPVESSNVQSVKYKEDSKELTVKFLGGGTYIYSDIPPQVATDMMESESKGRFVWQVLRGSGYPYRRLPSTGQKIKSTLFADQIHHYAGSPGFQAKMGRIADDVEKTLRAYLLTGTYGYDDTEDELTEIRLRFLRAVGARQKEIFGDEITETGLSSIPSVDDAQAMYATSELIGAAFNRLRTGTVMNPGNLPMGWEIDEFDRSNLSESADQIHHYNEGFRADMRRIADEALELLESVIVSDEGWGPEGGTGLSSASEARDELDVIILEYDTILQRTSPSGEIAPQFLRDGEDAKEAIITQQVLSSVESKLSNYSAVNRGRYWGPNFSETVNNIHQYDEGFRSKMRKIADDALELLEGVIVDDRLPDHVATSRGAMNTLWDRFSATLQAQAGPQATWRQEADIASDVQVHPWAPPSPERLQDSNDAKEALITEHTLEQVERKISSPSYTGPWRLPFVESADAIHSFGEDFQSKMRDIADRTMDWLERTIGHGTSSQTPYKGMDFDPENFDAYNALRDEYTSALLKNVTPGDTSGHDVDAEFIRDRDDAKEAVITKKVLNQAYLRLNSLKAPFTESADNIHNFDEGFQSTMRRIADEALDSVEGALTKGPKRLGAQTLEDAQDFLSNLWSEYTSALREHAPKGHPLGSMADLLPQFLKDSGDAKEAFITKQVLSQASDKVRTQLGYGDMPLPSGRPRSKLPWQLPFAESVDNMHQFGVFSRGPYNFELALTPGTVVSPSNQDLREIEHGVIVKGTGNRVGKLSVFVPHEDMDEPGWAEYKRQGGSADQLYVNYGLIERDWEPGVKNLLNMARQLKRFYPSFRTIAWKRAPLKWRDVFEVDRAGLERGYPIPTQKHPGLKELPLRLGQMGVSGIDEDLRGTGFPGLFNRIRKGPNFWPIPDRFFDRNPKITRSRYLPAPSNDEFHRIKLAEDSDNLHQFVDYKLALTPVGVIGPARFDDPFEVAEHGILLQGTSKRVGKLSLHLVGKDEIVGPATGGGILMVDYAMIADRWQPGYANIRNMLRQLKRIYPWATDIIWDRPYPAFRSLTSAAGKAGGPPPPIPEEGNPDLDIAEKERQGWASLPQLMRGVKRAQHALRLAEDTAGASNFTQEGDGEDDAEGRSLIERLDALVESFNHWKARLDDPESSQTQKVRAGQTQMAPTILEAINTSKEVLELAADDDKDLSLDIIRALRQGIRRVDAAADKALEIYNHRRQSVGWATPDPFKKDFPDLFAERSGDSTARQILDVFNDMIRNLREGHAPFVDIQSGFIMVDDDLERLVTAYPGQVSGDLLEDLLNARADLGGELLKEHRLAWRRSGMNRRQLQLDEVWRTDVQNRLGSRSPFTTNFPELFADNIHNLSVGV